MIPEEFKQLILEHLEKSNTVFLVFGNISSDLDTKDPIGAFVMGEHPNILYTLGKVNASRAAYKTFNQRDIENRS